MIIYHLCSGRLILIFHSYLLAAPAAMEHEKAPGRPQALLKKDQNLIKNGAVGYRPRLSVCVSVRVCVCHAF